MEMIKIFIFFRKRCRRPPTNRPFLPRHCTERDRAISTYLRTLGRRDGISPQNPIVTGPTTIFALSGGQIWLGDGPSANREVDNKPPPEYWETVGKETTEIAPPTYEDAAKNEQTEVKIV